MRLEDRRKSAAIAYLLLLFFGLLGAHRFYLGHVGSATALLLLTLASLALIPFHVGWGLAWLPPLWLLTDLFLVPAMVARHNAELTQVALP
ncbi:MAG: NINE protein [Alphaproteobacteria bacterium]|nr:NINE protein [Alphaproteobacteria bacterium]